MAGIAVARGMWPVSAVLLCVCLTVATRFCTVSLTVTRRPLKDMVALAISSATFLADRPRGPTLGARDDAPAASPPKARR